MVCNGWFIDDEFVPLADYRQGQANGVATLTENGELAQETEALPIYGEDIPVSEEDSTPLTKYISAQLTGVILEVSFA